MQVNVHTRLSNPTGRGALKLSRLAKLSLEAFFRYSPEEVSEVDLVILAAERGGNAQQLIKTIPQRDEARAHEATVSVNVYAEGTQGVIGFMTAVGYTATELEELIENGPYNLKPRRGTKPSLEVEDQVAVLAASEPAAASVSEPMALSIQPQPEVQNETVVEAPPPRLTPREKFVRAGMAEEELDRLMATLSAIVYREVERQGFAEVPSTLRVSVERISLAIMDHMRLPHSRAGNYQGIIGSFYSSRIALFALKYDYQDQESDAQYADWLFDCSLVLDFVGGRDQLAALAIHREAEVEAREASEATREPTPEAVVVEKAAQEGFLPDNSLFDLALRFLAGRDDAVAEQQLAEANLQKQIERAEALRQQLREAERAVEAARGLVVAAEEKVSSLTLSDATKARIREAKERLDALAARLGI